MFSRYIDNFDFSSRFRILKGGKISLVVSALLGSVIIASAAPTDGVVTSGTATISQTGNTTNINQTTSKASINWQNFNIASNETVNFNQPNANSITLNRVIGNEKSVINGALNANGQVWILNSNGILFSKDAKVNTSGLVATTAELSDKDFQDGNYNFKNSKSNSVVNLGTIEVANNGYVVLASNEVRNTGTIKAIKGKVYLSGNSEYTINLNGNSIVNLIVTKGILDSMVENSGTIVANGGEIYLTTNAVNELLKGVVNNTGIIEANSLDDVTGKVEVFAHGGTANVGGEIKAEGGFVETSGKNVKIASGTKIKSKKWLIDPTDFTVAATGGDLTGNDISDYLNDGGDMLISTDYGTNGTNGDIFINDAISWSTNNYLELNAYRNIYINSNITATNAAGKVKLYYGQGAVASGNTANYSFGLTDSGFTGKINLQAGQNFSTKLGSDGTVKTYQVITSLGTVSSTTGTDLQGINGNLAGNYVLGSNIDATATAGNNATWRYIYYSSYYGYGFRPIGSSNGQAFTGTFDGLGHTINNLYISHPNYNPFYLQSTGLFSSTNNANISNVALTNLDMPSNSVTNVGGLVGNATNTKISNSYVTTATSKIIGGATNVGGLVGNISGANSIIKNSWTNATVQGSTAGGLVGNITSNASITNSYAKGNLESGNIQGGLVGSTNGATITDSYASGNVGNNTYYNTMGGLVGSVTSSVISNSYYSGGIINGGNYLGGLFGTYDLASTISNTYYNINNTTIKEASGVITLGGIYSDLYTFWQNANRISLVASSYLATVDADFYELASLSDLKESLAFVYQDGIKFKLTSDLNLNDSTTNLTGWNLSRFKGTFDGNSKTLSNVNINQDFNKDVGLFGKLDGATVSNLTISGATVKGNGNAAVLAGSSNNSSSISGVVVTGANVTGGSDGNIGGLVGLNTTSSTISGSSTAGTLSGTGVNSGGLVGFNNSAATTLTNSSSIYTSSSSVNLNVSQSQVGGLVGKNSGSKIDTSFATGNVNFVTPSTFTTYYQDIGGLVGLNTASSIISNSYASGTVSGNENIGGLVGLHESSSTIEENSYATGIVQGTTDVGGLVGQSSSSTIIGSSTITNTVSVHSSGTNIGGLVGYALSSTISDSYSEKNVATNTNSNQIGGLVGYASGSTISNSYATGTVNGEYDIGGLVGWLSNGSKIISGSYYSGSSVSGTRNIGGLVGSDYLDKGNNNSQNSVLHDTSTYISNSFYNADSVNINSGKNVTLGAMYNKQYSDWISANRAALNIASDSRFIVDNGYYGITASNIEFVLGYAYHDGIKFKLTENIDLSNIAHSDSTSGKLSQWHLAQFGRMGANGASFDGAGFTLSNPNVTQTFNNDIGLFGRVINAEVKNLNINTTSTGTATLGGYANVGTLVGYNHKGTISDINLFNSTVTGGSGFSASGVAGYGVGGLIGYSKANSTISKINSSSTPLTANVSSNGNYVGGLVGYNDSTTITNANTNVILGGSGYYYLGGLVGYNTASNISNSTTTGSISGTSKNYIGGVVGYNTTNSDISNTSSSLNITGTGSYVGGLVGYNTTNSDITGSSTSGTISGSSYVGGLVGQNTGSGAKITGSSSTSVVSGSSVIGGLVGDNSGGAIIDSSYHTTGTVSGTSSLGGLVGQNSGATIQNNSYASGIITGNSGSTAVGGLVGLNSTNSSIADSYVTGATVSGTNQVGGLTGDNSGTVNISNSYVQNSSVAGGRDVGGLVGGQYNSALTISNSYYNVDNVSINGATHMTLGGIYNKQFTDWKPTKTALSLDTYFSKDASNNYLITASNIEFLPAFVYMTTAQGAKFKLADDVTNIDLSTISHSDSTAGYLKELSLKEFKGTFDGNGKTLSNLNIDQLFNGDIGFFGRAIGATISNLTFSTPTLKGYYNVGTLAGYADKTNVDNVDVTNLTITGDSTLPSGKIGGLIGYNKVSSGSGYTLQNSQVSGTINGEGSYIAGLVGSNEQVAISNSSANVAVSSTSGDYVAGLVGYNYGANITNSSATGNVTATGKNYVGGLIGYNTGIGGTGSLISGSFATGKVIGASYIGGLIGSNTTYSTINGSYATGDVEATGYYVGGLVGQNSSGAISGSTASGDVVSSGDYTGGFIGQNSSSTISNSNSIGNVTATGKNYVGGLVGYNSSSAISGTTSASGNVVGGNYAGGLVGYNSSSTITGATASGIVNGASYVGGLVGQNLTSSAISTSSASGDVTGTSGRVGGLVGDNSSIITSSFATGNVLGKNSSDVYQNYVGGLVGFNSNSNISASYHTTGTVQGLDYVGGLVGQNQGTSTQYVIDTSYSSGSVSGRNYVAGLVGYSYYNSSITNSYVANGSSVSGTKNVGGLVGMSDTISQPTYPAIVTNSFYNVNNVTINGGNYVTLGGIYNKQFTDWMSATTPRTALTASTYFGAAEGSGYYTLNKNNIEYALAFANVSGMKFKLGETIDVSDITQAGTASTKLTDWHLAEFRGNLDGNSKALLNVVVNQSFNDEVGVIGRLIGGSITNLGVAGTSTISGNDNVGGLVGKSQNSTISGSFSNATVNGTSKAGGLVGYNYQQSTTTSITDSYATGNVGSATGSSIGGLVGYNQGGTLTRTYATGIVTGSSKGGLIGYNSGTIANSLYNSASTGTVTATGATAKTLSELKSLATYTAAGWTTGQIRNTGTASGQTWRIYEGSTGPLLVSYLTALSGTIDSTAISKTYDGNAQIQGSINWATTPTNSLVLGTPTITVSSKNVGTYNSGTIAEVYSSQLGYDFTVTGSAPTVTINAKSLSAALTGTITKEYNGNTDVTLTSSNYDLTGFISGEGASVTKTAGTYNDKDVADATSASVTLASSDFTENSGTLLSNYTFPTTATGTATITKKALGSSLTGTITKAYDGNTDATLTSSNFDLTGFISGEGASVTKTAGTYNDKDVADATSASVTLASSDFTENSGTLLSNYTLPTTASGTASITKKALTITGTTASDKVYDGTTDVTETIGTLSGFVTGEIVSTTAVGTFASKDVGNRTATFVYTLVDGTNGELANNYSLANTTDDAEITKKALTITGTTASDKVYDGTTDVTETIGTLSGFVTGEIVSTTAVGTFASKDVGNRTATFVYTLVDGTNGELANNYSLANTTDDAEITKKALTITGTTASDKVYDGTTDVTETIGTLSGFVIGEIVSTTAVGTFASKDVGNRTATFVYTLVDGTNGELANNYSLANTTDDAEITKKALTITGTTASDKVYDGTTDVTETIGTLSGFVTGEIVSTTAVGTFASKDVGNRTATFVYTLVDGTNGELANNYSLANTTDDAEITKKALTITGTTASDKVYDGTTDVTETIGTLSGFVTGEIVSTTAVGTFASKDVGNRTATFVYTLVDGTNGELANNYSLANTTDDAEITKKALTITGTTASDKVYDGTTDVTETIGTLSGFVTGEIVSTTAVGTFASKDVGNRTATFVYTLVDGTNGELANNYSLANTTDDAEITKKALTITGTTASDKVYDGTTDVTETIGTLSGFVIGEIVSTTAVGTFASKDVGNRTATFVYTLVDGTNGELANNYSLANTTDDAEITKKALTITGTTASDKVYDGTTDVTETIGTLSGFVIGEIVSTTAVGTFASKDVGNRTATFVYTLVDGTNGELANNYSLANTTDDAEITKKALTITGTTASDKVYDGTTDVTETIGTLSGFVIGEIVSTTAVGTFASKDVGNRTATFVYTLADGTNGELANNYSLANTTDDAEITSRVIELSATNLTKIYGEVDPTLVYTITNGTKIGSDNLGVSLVRTSGEDVNTTTGYAITNNGTLNSNYNVTFIDGKLNITPRAITLTADSKTKVYKDANPILTYQIEQANENRGLVNNDTFTGNLSTNANLNSDIGNYDITSTLLNTNYNINYVPAQLNITSKNITAQVSLKTSEVTGVPVKLDGILSSELISQGAKIVVLDASNHDVTELALHGKIQPGKYSVKAVNDNTNYALNSNTVELTINPALDPITVVKTQVSVPVIPVTTAPVVTVNAPTTQNTQISNNLSVKLGITDSGNVNLVSQTTVGQANQVVTLSELKTSSQDNANEKKEIKLDDVRVSLSQNSIVQLVNGGVNLPTGVDQQFYVVRQDINTNSSNGTTNQNSETKDNKKNKGTN